MNPRAPKLMAIAVSVLIAIMVLPLVAPAASASAYTLPGKPGVSPEEKIAPELLKPGAYNTIVGDQELDKLIIEGIAHSGLKFYRGPGHLARVAIYYRGGDQELRVIEENVYRVTSALKTGRLSVAFALATQKQVEKLATLPFVLRIEPQRSLLDELQPRSAPEALAAPHTPTPLGGTGSGDGYLIYSAPNLTGAAYVWEHYNISGQGVKIGIVDTGVDLGSPDLGSSKVATDNGLPLTFDADELGLTLMIPVQKINDTYINVTGSPDFNNEIPVFIDGDIYVTDHAFATALNLINGEEYTYNLGILNKAYEIPSGISGNITFGLVFQVLVVYYTEQGIPMYGILEYTAPAIFADTNGDGTFDTVYIDLSTTYYMVMEALHNVTNGAMPEADSSLLDMSFADETGLSYNGTLTASRDFTGDGVPDFSLGALAGALYDYYGVFGPSKEYGLDWMSDWEPTSYVIPGLDTQHGRWIDLLYDFYGHGTACAHVAAASGETNRTIISTAPGVNFTTKMPGMAPNATVGAAVALWNGDFITAELWLAGFDQVNAETYTWNYTGNHKVDIISNSWGFSTLLYNGFASDADPKSLWEDFISIVSNTIIVHAAGNGGPGLGSVTIPGAAAFVITVGAAVDFYYRPVSGIGNATYLPGTYGPVVSWSDRGPTELGYPKPDVLAIGSFEWAGSRAIQAPYNGTYAYELFGGTSEATPMTAGVVALIVQALRENNITPTPLLVKAILKSTATNMGFDAYSQGSGFINATKAIETIEDGGYIAYSYDSALNLLQYIDESMAAMLNMNLSQVWSTFEDKVADTAVYPGAMLPGQTRNVTVVIQALGGASNISANVSDYTLRLAGQLSLGDVLNVSAARNITAAANGTVLSENASSLFYVDSEGNVYLNISALPPGSRIAIPLTSTAADEVLKGNLSVLALGFPASYYFASQPDGRPDPTHNKIDAIWELVVWFDLNNDSVIDAYKNGTKYYYETSRLNYDYRIGPVYHLELGDPQMAILRAAEAVANYTNISVSTLLSVAHLAVELRIFGNQWYNTSTSLMPLYGYLAIYNASDCGMASEPSSVSSNTTEATFDVTISVPSNAEPGIYEGYVVINSSYGVINVPLSIPVAKPVNPWARMSYVIKGSPQGYYYDNYAFRSTLDQGWRPEVGDWRVYPIAIFNELPEFISGGVHVVVAWSNPNADYDTGLIGPGVNWWGVFNTSYAAYIDAAVLGAKLTYPYVVGGVYSYFDYPLPGIASFDAPIDSVRYFRPGAENETYTIYWLVVHQKFSDHDGEAPEIFLTFDRFMMPNIYYIHSGLKGVKANVYISAYYSDIELLDYALIPLGSGTGLNVTPHVSGTGRAHYYIFQYDATNAGTGSYLLEMLVMEPHSYSVVIGWTSPQYGYPMGVKAIPAVPMIYVTAAGFVVH